MMTLRDYQTAAVQALWRHIREKDTNPCVVIPTAGGKSICIAEAVRNAVTEWGGRVLILAHVKELIEQNAGKIAALCPEIPVGIYSAGLNSKATKEPVIAAGIQSIAGHADLFKPFDLVMIDEAHLIPTEGEGRYRTFLSELKARSPNIRLVGWTATPYRTKGGLICKKENILQEVCYEISVKELMNRGCISQLVSKSGRVKPELGNLHVRAGEFVQDEIDEAMGEEAIIVNACREIAELTKERKTCLVFCTSVKNCERTARLITQYTGEECPVVTGETPAHERAAIIRRLRGEEIVADLFGAKASPLKYCCNVSVMTTGTDIPNIDTVVLLRPTASAGLLVQMVGRGFRLSPSTGKKECLVLDYGKNIERFGCIDQIKATEPRSGFREGPLAKECPNCRAMLPLSVMHCGVCGHDFAPKVKEERLDSAASTLSLISGEVEVDDYPVLRTDYQVWKKVGSPPGAPKTVRVDYTVDLMTRFSEWLCPEHNGYARRKFEKWWREHAVSGTPIPATVEEVCEANFTGVIRPPKQITVKRISGRKFPEIVGYELDAAPIEARLPDSVEADDEDLPF